MTFSSVIYIMALTALFGKEKDSARLQAWKQIKKNFLGQR